MKSSTLTAFWAPVSSLDWITVIWPTSAGSRSSAAWGMPICSPRLRTATPRSSTIVPSAVDTLARVSSRRIATAASSATRFAVCQTDWNLLDAMICSMPSVAGPRSAPASGPARPARSSGSRRFEFAGDVDRREQLVRQVQRQRLLDLRLVEQIAAELDPLVGVERLGAHPRRHRRHDRQHGGQTDQQAAGSQRGPFVASSLDGVTSSLDGVCSSVMVVVPFRSLSRCRRRAGLRSLAIIAGRGPRRHHPVWTSRPDRPVPLGSQMIGTVDSWIGSRSRSS